MNNPSTSHHDLSERCKQWLGNEQALFDQDYQRHAIAGQSKAKSIGRPFLLHNKQNTKGILLIHGLMAAPFEVKLWADHLHAQGYNVYAPRLTGHGTSAADLAKRTKNEWHNSVKRGYEILAECCDEVAIAGFSTGAALALNMVIKYPKYFTALISISAPLKLKKFSAHFASPVNSWNCLLTLLSINKAKKEFVTNHADNPHINYLQCPVASIVQIKKLMRDVRRGLKNITIPTLIMHATSDPKVDIQSSKEIFRLIGNSCNQYQEIDFNRHGIINGEISNQIFAHVDQFLVNSYQ